MANLTTSTDILHDALFRCGEPTDGTSDFHAQTLIHLNRAYREIWMGGGALDPQINETWWWLRAEASLILQPVYKTGTLGVTQNNATVSFSSAPSDDLTGWFLKTDDWADVFKISSHSGGVASADLDTVFTGDTNTAATFRCFKLDYDLASDFMKLNGEMRQYQKSPYWITGDSNRVMEELYPLHKLLAGAPTHFSFVDTNTVRFNAQGDDDGDYIRVDYDYILQPSDLAEDTNEPLVPLRYRQVLSDYSAMYLFEDKNDDRSTSMAALGRSGMRSMSRENRQKWAAIGEPGNIVPRQEHKSFRVLKTESGLVLYG